MKTYEKPIIEVTEVRTESMLAGSQTLGTGSYQSGKPVLGNGRRDAWSNGWDD